MATARLPIHCAAAALLVACAVPPSRRVASQYDGTVTRVDARTNQVTASIALQARPSGLALTGDALWVTRYDEASVLRIDTRTNAPTGERIAVGAQPVLATFAEGSLWVSNALSASVSRVDE